MSIVISGSAIPNEMMTKITNLLDVRSQASFSQVCKHFREIINNTGLSLSTLGFTLCLTDELFLSGLYTRGLTSKSAEECEVFKANIGNQWFAALDGTSTIPDHLLTFAICRLAAERAWSDAKIKNLCRIFNRDAKKEMPNVAYSWKVISKKLIT